MCSVTEYRVNWLIIVKERLEERKDMGGLKVGGVKQIGLDTNADRLIPNGL